MQAQSAAVAQMQNDPRPGLDANDVTSVDRQPAARIASPLPAELVAVSRRRPGRTPAEQPLDAGPCREATGHRRERGVSFVQRHAEATKGSPAAHRRFSSSASPHDRRKR